MANTRAIATNDVVIESSDEKQLNRWQRSLLPWMVILPTVLIVGFVYLATLQLGEFSRQINTYKVSELDKVFVNAKDSSLRVPPNADSKEFLKLYLLAKMDEELMNKRYSQAGSLLIARLYTKYLGFFTGMILAIVGAVFIISKLSESTSTLEGSMNAYKISLISASPGIIFGCLGTMLMLSTILHHTDIDVRDAANFINAGTVTPGTIRIEPSPSTSNADPALDREMQSSSPYPNRDTTKP
jgi:hypothetical protein